jgi:hypothetical protein
MLQPGFRLALELTADAASAGVTGVPVGHGRPASGSDEGAAIGDDANGIPAHGVVLHDLKVDWAEPLHEVSPELMSTVKILYVSCLPPNPADASEGMLAAMFARYGAVERVKRLKNFAFVHFRSRDEAAAAMAGLQNAVVAGHAISIQWSKPPPKSLPAPVPPSSAHARGYPYGSSTAPVTEPPTFMAWAMPGSLAAQAVPAGGGGGDMGAAGWSEHGRAYVGTHPYGYGPRGLHDGRHPPAPAQAAVGGVTTGLHQRAPPAQPRHASLTAGRGAELRASSGDGGDGVAYGYGAPWGYGHVSGVYNPGTPSTSTHADSSPRPLTPGERWSSASSVAGPRRVGDAEAWDASMLATPAATMHADGATPHSRVGARDGADSSRRATPADTEWQSQISTVTEVPRGHGPRPHSQASGSVIEVQPWTSAAPLRPGAGHLAGSAAASHPAVSGNRVPAPPTRLWDIQQHAEAGDRAFPPSYARSAHPGSSGPAADLERRADHAQPHAWRQGPAHRYAPPPAAWAAWAPTDAAYQGQYQGVYLPDRAAHAHYALAYADHHVAPVPPPLPAPAHGHWDGAPHSHEPRWGNDIARQGMPYDTRPHHDPAAGDAGTPYYDASWQTSGSLQPPTQQYAPPHAFAQGWQQERGPHSADHGATPAPSEYARDPRLRHPQHRVAVDYNAPRPVPPRSDGGAGTGAPGSAAAQTGEFGGRATDAGTPSNGLDVSFAATVPLFQYPLLGITAALGLPVSAVAGSPRDVSRGDSGQGLHQHAGGTGGQAHAHPHRSGGTRTSDGITVGPGRLSSIALPGNFGGDAHAGGVRPGGQLQAGSDGGNGGEPGGATPTGADFSTVQRLWAALSLDE